MCRNQRVLIWSVWNRHGQAMSLTLKTNLGVLKVELFCQQCPKTCKNFLALAASGYYDNTTFHRNIKGFMIQAGDPTGTGKGGQSIWGGYFEDEFVSTLKHERRGCLSMVNTGPNTNGSQFFITYARQPHLNGAWHLAPYKAVCLRVF